MCLVGLPARRYFVTVPELDSEYEEEYLCATCYPLWQAWHNRVQVIQGDGYKGMPRLSSLRWP